MSWKCSVCGKEFAKNNQSHMCVQKNVEDLFLRSEAGIFEAYNSLIQKLSKRLQFTITTSSKSITLYAPNHKAFYVMKPGKTFLDSFFILDEKLEDFPVYKVAQPSKTKFAHFIRFYAASDVDKIVLSLIEQSYRLIGKK
jgi:Domain of unknown function (DUF5655)